MRQFSITDLEISSNYKPCKPKQYDMYVCMPPKGTVVLNKFKCSRVLGDLGGKTYFTIEQLNKLKANNPSIFEGLSQLVRQRLAYITDSRNPFVFCGTSGEFWIGSFSDLVNECCIINSTGGTEVITESLLLKKRKGDGIPWFRVRKKVSNNNTNLYACFVPRRIQTNILTADGTTVALNDTAIKHHGNGDFVLVRGINGNIDTSRKRVVNGMVFALTYNNMGWQDCINSNAVENYVLEKPEELYTLMTNKADNSGNWGIETFKKYIEDLVASKKYIKIYNSINLVEICTKSDGSKYLHIVQDGYNNFELHMFNNGDYGLKLFDKYCANYKKSEVDKLKADLIPLLNIVKQDFESNFKAPCCSPDVYESINSFTGSAYDDMNRGMRTNDFSDLSFNEYNNICSIYKYLKTCRTGKSSGMVLFRGLNLDTPLHVGDKLSSRSFASLSLSISVAASFGDTIFMFRDISNLEAVYINSFSDFRDREFEVLLNAGYNFCVKRKFASQNGSDAYAIYECEFEKDTSYELSNTFDMDSLIFELNNVIQSDNTLGNFYYISAYDRDDGLAFFIRNYIDIDALSFKFSVADDSKSISIHRFTSKDTEKIAVPDGNIINAVIKILYSSRQNVTCDTSYLSDVWYKLYSRGSTFMFNMTHLFEESGYQILKQDFVKAEQWNNAEDGTPFKGVLTISGDNDDNISIFIKLTFAKDVLNRFNLEVRARSQNIKLAHTFEAIDINNFDILKSIYSTVTHKFKLNQFNRVERALSMICRYKKTDYRVVNKSNIEAVYVLDNKQLGVHIDGTTVNVKTARGSYSFQYYDNLNTISSSIYDLVKE